MYRAALVGLKPHRENVAAMYEAISVATKERLQLNALAVVDPDIAGPRQVAPIGAGFFKEHRDDVIKRQWHEEAQAALDAFTRLCTESGVECSTSHREGPLADEFALATQTADILILGHGGAAEAGSTAREDVAALGKILAAIARPCLLVPFRPADVNRVTVAYDGGLQSARAIYDFALSGLWKNAPVDVLSIAEDVSFASATADRATRYLNLHGYAATAHPIVARFDIADSILKAIEESGSGGLVMGAYSKPAWREFFIGSVTRSVLRAVMVPVLLSR